MEQEKKIVSKSFDLCECYRHHHYYLLNCIQYSRCQNVRNVATFLYPSRNALQETNRSLYLIKETCRCSWITFSNYYLKKFIIKTVIDYNISRKCSKCSSVNNAANTSVTISAKFDIFFVLNDQVFDVKHTVIISVVNSS